MVAPGERGEQVLGVADQERQLEGIELGLIYSRCFYFGFPMEADRTPTWRFVHYLALENQSEFTRKEVNAILDNTPLGDEHALIRKLLKALYLKNCISLESSNKEALPRDEEKLEKEQLLADIKIKLDPLFYDAISRYVDLFLKLVLHRDGLRIERGAALVLMRKLLDIQVHDNNPLWNKMIIDLAEAVERKGEDAAEFRRLTRESGECWLALHSIWYSHLKPDGASAFTPKQLEHYIQTELKTFVTEEELANVLMILGYAGVLNYKKRGRDISYSLNDNSHPVLEKYSLELARIRAGLVDKSTKFLETGEWS